MAQSTNSVAVVMVGVSGGGVSRGGGDSWRRLWETARAGVAVAQEIGSGARGKGVRVYKLGKARLLENRARLGEGMK